MPLTVPGWQPGIGRYLVRQAVGRGGLATVFCAWDTQHGCDVAIKLLHAHLCDDAVCLARFAREAAVLGRLEHPNVVSLLEKGVDQRRPFLVLGWVNGESVSDLLRRRRRLRLKQALSLAQQLACALAHVHGQRALHRDIKPANLMVSKPSAWPGQRPGSRDELRLTLIDFGLSLNLGEPVSPDDAQGFVLGSPGFLSPEQARGAMLDARSDLFNVGLLLWCLLSGRAPRPNQLPPQRWPPELKSLLRRCLAKRPAARWQCAADLVHALGNLPWVRTVRSQSRGPAGIPRVSGPGDAMLPRNRRRVSLRR